MTREEAIAKIVSREISILYAAKQTGIDKKELFEAVLKLRESQ